MEVSLDVKIAHINNNFTRLSEDDITKIYNIVSKNVPLEPVKILSEYF